MLTSRCRLQLGGRPDQFLRCQAFAEAARSAKIEPYARSAARREGTNGSFQPVANAPKEFAARIKG
jgi:hypothetical protein